MTDMITFTPIGYAETPHRRLEEIPVQPAYCRGIRGRIILQEQFAEGLTDLDGFNYIHLIFQFNHAMPAKMMVKPYLDDNLHGVFATRVPHRPNPIGLSLVRLLSVEGNILNVAEIDLLDGTPILDIKPYITDFDRRDDATLGWRAHISAEDIAVRAKREYKGETDR